MTLNYNTYVSQLSNMLSYSSTDSNFTTFLPGCIDYAEQRIYRELDILNTRVVDTTGVLAAQTRNFSLPTGQGTFIVVESISAIDGSGVRHQMVPVTKEFIDIVYPSQTLANGTPAYFAPITNAVFVVGPAPDVNYTAEVIGTQRPAPLSVGNSSTFLTQYVPDLFMAASLVFAFGFQRDFGGQSEDPQASQSWEAQYNKLLASASQEQLRARYEGAAWTPMEQAQVQPPRV